MLIIPKQNAPKGKPHLYYDNKRTTASFNVNIIIIEIIRVKVDLLKKEGKFHSLFLSKIKYIAE